MDISEIKMLLANENPQLRLRGLVALKDYDSETAVPLLIEQRQDEAFLVRSFVAMGLGRKRNEQAYNTLLKMIETETDSNVQAEIANSLGLYGSLATERLVKLFEENDHWLVQRSILAIMPDMESPQSLLQIALKAIENDDQTIVQAGISTLGLLAGTAQEQAALAALLPQANSDSWRLRLTLARALKRFDDQSARDALVKLRQDSNHKVVAATLEELLPN